MTDREELYKKYPQLFKPGEGGRPKGTKNKSPKLIREAITKVIEGKADKLDEWIDEIADQGIYGRVKAIELIIKLAEFVLPKLSKNQISAEVTNQTVIVGKPKDLELPKAEATDDVHDLTPEPESEKQHPNNNTDDKADDVSGD